MSRDFGVPVVLGLLALAVLPAAGLAPGLGVPATMAGFLSFVLALTAFGALVVFPWIGPHGVRGVGRVGAMVVVTAPFVVFALMEAPHLSGVTLVPAPAWWFALAGGLTLAAAHPTRAVPLGVALLALLGLDAVLGAADRPILPRAWVAAAGPVIEVGGPPGADPGRVTVSVVPEGLRPGDPVTVDSPPLGAGAGPWYVPAARGRYPSSTPLVAVLGAAGSAGETTGVRFVSAAELDPRAVLTLDAFRGAVLLPGAWPARLGEPGPWADALATYARRGGLLIGPAPDRAWPPAIGRRLGRAGASHGEAAESVRPYGLGAVARASSERGIRDLLLTGRGLPRLSTVFHGRDERLPSGDALLERPGSPRGTRRMQGLLLLFYAVVAAALDRILRRGWPRLFGAIAPALAVTAGLLWSSPGDPGVEVRGVAFDLGGGGGRRVEAVLLAAGGAGWRGRVTWAGGGLVRLAGGRVEVGGRVRLRPGERAWAIRESVAEGKFRGERESPAEAHLLRFVRGPVDPARVRLGRVAALPVQIEGVGCPAAATLTIP